MDDPDAGMGVHGCFSTVFFAYFQNLIDIFGQVLRGYSRILDKRQGLFISFEAQHQSQSLFSDDPYIFISLTFRKKWVRVAESFFFQSCYHLSCLLYTSPSPRDGLLSRMPSS